MKKFYSKWLIGLFCVSFVSGSASAKKLTETEAQDVASSFFKQTSGLRQTRAGDATLKLAKATEGYYAFNRGKASGYVIVAADDRASASVLGYADEGTIDVDNMPANMAWWLSEYDRQMAYMDSHPQAGAQTRTASAETRAAIEPLVTAKWDQGEPYNGLCPTIGTEKCITGCVATAMAQIMYYHKWPLQGTGSHSYEWNGQTLSVDFSKSTYDWDSMTDTYDGNSSQASRDAVAKLMYDMGVAVEMQYSPTISPAYAIDAGKALINYFGYDHGARIFSREKFGLEEWTSLLYKELSEGRPMYYGGQTSESLEEGHAFVCDGYSGDGYFHINWGWGGRCDGYFLLTALTPNIYGVIGGDGVGYNYGQAAIVGIQKPVEQWTNEPMYWCMTDFATEESTVSFSDVVHFTGEYWWVSLENKSVTIGIKVVDVLGNATYYEMFDADAKTNCYYIFSRSMQWFPKEEGVYTLSPAYYDETIGMWIDMYTPKHLLGSLTAMVKGNIITFSEPVAPTITLTATNLSVTSAIYSGKQFTAKATITCKGGEYYDDVHVAFVSADAPNPDNESAGVLINLTDGMSQEVEFMSIAPRKAGQYSLVVLDDDDNIISEAIPITVKETPTGPLSIEISEPLVVENASAVDAGNMHVIAKVRCSSGFYAGEMSVWIWSEDYSEYCCLQRKNVMIAAGEDLTLEFEGAFEEAEEGKLYHAYLFYEINSSLEQLGYNTDFTIASATGIDSPSQAESSEGIRIYSLSGSLVATQEGTAPDMAALPKGVYIVKQGSKTYKVTKK